MTPKQIRARAAELNILSRIKRDDGKPYKHVAEIPLKVVAAFIETEPLRLKDEAATKAWNEAEANTAWEQFHAHNAAELAAVNQRKRTYDGHARVEANTARNELGLFTGFGTLKDQLRQVRVPQAMAAK